MGRNVLIAAVLLALFSCQKRTRYRSKGQAEAQAVMLTGSTSSCYGGPTLDGCSTVEDPFVCVRFTDGPMVMCPADASQQCTIVHEEPEASR